MGIALEVLNMSEIISLSGNTIALFMFFAFLWFLFLWIVFFIIWTDYYLDVLIVTDKHVIDIQQMGLFSRDISTLRLDRVQDITTEVHGIIATLLGFGNLQIQTAGESKEFVIKGIPKPTEVKKRILVVYDKAVANGKK